MMRLVIIIPTKNRRTLLERAVESVRSQDGEWRAIVIDDASTDETAGYLKTLAVSDTRFTILNNETNQGVNVARNRALAMLEEGEWGFLLDDDDLLLPGAIARMQERIAVLSPRFEYVFFNSRIKTSRETYSGGYQFGESDAGYYDPSYLDVITKHGLRGDCKPAIAASLVWKGYRFAEDVNGFESEFNALVARDGVGIRYFRDEAVFIDQAHGQERLSDTAAMRDPASFIRVHKRMLDEHRVLFERYPRLMRLRLRAGIKVAVRVADFGALARFSFLWLMSFFLRDEEE